jgi:hypothetical protein
MSSGGENKKEEQKSRNERMINNFNGFSPILFLIQCQWHLLGEKNK